MAANTVSTHNLVGIRESLADVISILADDETPLLSAIGSKGIESTYPEWEIDTNITPSTSNAVIEGDDATIDPGLQPTRVGNRTQIMDATAEVSRTSRRVQIAGQADPLDYQILKRGTWLRTSLEATVFSNQAMNAGATSTARRMGTLGAWVGTNDSLGTGAAASPVGANGTAARTDGTQRPFVEEDFNTVMQLAWTAGGKPNQLYVSPFNKRVVSRSFTGIATAMREVTTKRVTSAVTMLDTDFGEVRVIPTRTQRSRDAWVIDPSLLSIGYLDNMQSKPLPSMGHYDRELIWLEATLLVENERGLGLVADLTTS